MSPVFEPNHYAFGAVGRWMYGTIAGITLDPAAPGGKHLLIAPRPGGGLTHARASLETPYGRVVSTWRIDGNRFLLDVEIPPNATADVTLRDTHADRVTGLAGVRGTEQRGADLVVRVGSGAYEFTVTR